MIRTFVDGNQLRDGLLVISGPDARHLGGSLRLRPGERFVAVTPDRIEHLCAVTAATPSRVEAAVVSSTPTRLEPRLLVRVCQALLKGDQFERILEYGTELGVAEFQPLSTERTIPRLDPAKAESRARRWAEVVRGAAALGQRGRVPEILYLTSAVDAVTHARRAGLSCLVLYEGRVTESLSTVPFENGGVCLLVGPEGGWSDAEIAAMTESGAIAVTLGPRIMRPLPAALAALAVLFHRAGELVLPEEV